MKIGFLKKSLTPSIQKKWSRGLKTLKTMKNKEKSYLIKIPKILKFLNSFVLGPAHGPEARKLHLKSL